MSELKRVQFTTLQTSDTTATSKKLSTNSSKTFRFDLNLFEPNADSFPEFNYSKLLYVEKKKKKKISKQVNGFSAASGPPGGDPFEDNDDDVNRIAKAFERKYGNSYAAGRKGATNDYDRGAGYDENDDFIDNTEAYDEVIPDEIEADRGGFYINSGALEFKPLANFERPDDAQRMPKPRKRNLSTTSESSGESGSDLEKKTNLLKNGHSDKKVKVSSDKESSANHKSHHKDKTRVEKVKHKKDDGAGSDSGKDTKKAIKTTTVKDMLRAKRDSMRNMVDGGPKSEQSDDDSAGATSSSADSSDSSDDERSDANGKKDAANRADIKLPENLPNDLLENIKKIIESSKLENMGKHNFFDETNMNLLYEIDTVARQKGGVIRNQIINYLESYLPCTKQTILIRAKKIRIQKEEAKTNKILKQLKQVVGTMMPDILQNHEAECKRIAELRLAASNAAKNSDANGEQLPQPNYKTPKKRFPWNDKLRNILFELFTVRRQSFNVINQRKETIEEFVNRYLKEHVLKVWPDGWMKLEDLHKEFDKRKLGTSKKPKENKKPIEAAAVAGAGSAAATPNTLSIENSKNSLTISTSLAASAAVQATAATTTTTTTSKTNTNNNTIDPIKKSVATNLSITKEAKSILSTNNSLKDLTITSTASKVDSKKIDLPSSNLTVTAAAAATIQLSSPPRTPSFENTFTLTPIGDSNVTSKPLPSVQNKVIITNVESNMPSQTSTTTTTTTTNQNKLPSASTSSATTTTASTTTSTSTQQNSKKSNNSTSNNNKAIKSVTIPASTTITIENSPPKKSTDHSINSIISSPPPSNHSVVNNSGNNSDTSTTSTEPSAQTHVINLDNLTNTDILNTAAAAATAAVAPTSKSSVLVNNNSESNSLKVKSMTSLLKKSVDVKSKPKSPTQFVDNKKENVKKSTAIVAPTIVVAKQQPPPKLSVTNFPTQYVEDISSSSDDVEFVGMTEPPKKIAKFSTSNKNKFIKKFCSSNESSRSNSPQLKYKNPYSPGHHKKDPLRHVKSSAEATTILDADDDDDDTDDLDVKDVDNIMKALKELQEMQTMPSSSNRIADGAFKFDTHSSKSDNMSANNYRHHSNSSYNKNKKLDHLEHSSKLQNKS